jgi:hypothetical protein
MTAATATDEKPESNKKIGGAASFWKRWWRLLAGLAAGGLTAVLVIIASTRPDIGKIKPNGLPSDPQATHFNMVRVHDTPKAVDVQSANVDVANEETLRTAKQAEERKRRSEAERAFLEDHPMIRGSHAYYRHLVNARTSKWNELIRQNRPFWEENMTEIIELDKLTTELGKALITIDMANSDEPVGPGTLGEVVTTILDDVESFGAIKQELADVVMKHLHDPATAAQIRSASNLADLTESASRVAPALRTVYLNRLGQFTPDPAWQDVFDQAVIDRAFKELPYKYQKLVTEKVGKEYGWED